jgi:hypothetical protein
LPQAMVEDLFFTACKDGDCKRVKELLNDCEDNARKAQVNDGFQWLFESFVSGCAEILPGHVEMTMVLLWQFAIRYVH